MLIELFGVISVLVFIIVFLLHRTAAMKRMLQQALFDRRSSDVKHGKMAEQFFPFMKGYPYEPGQFRFIGSPIDGVQFEKDKIVFIEFKTGNSQLTTKQKDIRKLVEKGRVAWKEVNVR